MRQPLILAAYVLSGAFLAGCGFDRTGLAGSSSVVLVDGGKDPEPPPTAPIPPAPERPPADAAAADAAARPITPIPMDALEAAPPSAPVAGECDIVPRPVTVTMLPASESGDLTFDAEGFLVLPADRNIVRLAKGAVPTTVVASALGADRILYGVRILADGGIVITDNRANSLTRIDATGARREFAMNAPIQFARGPGGALYVIGSDGELFLFDPSSGRTTVLTRIDGALRGITFSPDFKTLYVTERRSRSLRSFKLRADGSVEPPATWVSGLGASPDGLATDICGNVYVADNSGDPLLRVIVNGARLEPISDVRTARASALAFGSGRQGWDARNLYAVSENGGGLYEIQIGIRGAPTWP
jgi:sugar lactone lactonase YvrE